MMRPLYTRFFFTHLIPGACIVCMILFLLEVPVEEGYRVSLIEWSMDTDRAFPYLLAVGLVASAFCGSLVDILRVLSLDRWALPCPGRSGAARPDAPSEAPAAPPAAVPTPLPPPGAANSATPIAEPASRAARPGPLGALYGNLALTSLAALVWITTKIVRGGGTEIFPRRIAYGIPVACLAVCVLFVAGYRREADWGAPAGKPDAP